MEVVKLCHTRKREHYFGRLSFDSPSVRRLGPAATGLAITTSQKPPGYHFIIDRTNARNIAQNNCAVHTNLHGRTLISTAGGWGREGGEDG